MQQSFVRNASVLTYLGILPFVICTAALMVGFEQIKATQILISYAAVIVSFIAGIHWSQAMKQIESSCGWLLISSNIIALLAWGSLLVPHAVSSLALLIFLLLALLTIDHKLYTAGEIDAWFITLRRRVTTVVVVTLTLALVILL